MNPLAVAYLSCTRTCFAVPSPNRTSTYVNNNGLSLVWMYSYTGTRYLWFESKSVGEFWRGLNSLHYLVFYVSCEFKSRHRILDGHFFTCIFVVKFVMCVGKWKRGRSWPIFKKTELDKMKNSFFVWNKLIEHQCIKNNYNYFIIHCCNFVFILSAFSKK